MFLLHSRSGYLSGCLFSVNTMLHNTISVCLCTLMILFICCKRDPTVHHTRPVSAKQPALERSRLPCLVSDTGNEFTQLRFVTQVTTSSSASLQHGLAYHRLFSTKPLTSASYDCYSCQPAWRQTGFSLSTYCNQVTLCRATQLYCTCFFSEPSRFLEKMTLPSYTEIFHFLLTHKNSEGHKNVPLKLY